jgi:hypothetical protein
MREALSLIPNTKKEKSKRLIKKKSQYVILMIEDEVKE